MTEVPGICQAALFLRPCPSQMFSLSLSSFSVLQGAVWVTGELYFPCRPEGSVLRLLQEGKSVLTMGSGGVWQTSPTEAHLLRMGGGDGDSLVEWMIMRKWDQEVNLFPQPKHRGDNGNITEGIYFSLCVTCWSVWFLYLRSHDRVFLVSLTMILKSELFEAGQRDDLWW